MSLSRILRASLALFLLFPFLFLLTQFPFTRMPDGSELLWAFKNSLIQSMLSALFSLSAGCWVALGLLTFNEKRSPVTRRAFEILCLLPNFLPPIFILLSILNVIDPFPIGIAGIVIVHTFMNFGLAAVLIARTIESKISGLVELAYVEGAPRGLFISKVLLPLLKKDIAIIGLFIFVVCFGSFSVPLIVGGGKGTTIEVLIYEKIRLSTDWGDAVLLALMQSAFIFIVSSILVIQKTGVSRRSYANMSLLRSSSGIGVLIFLSYLYLYGYVEGFIAGLPMLSTLYDLQSAIIWNFLGSLVIGLSVGLLSYMTLFAIAYCWPKLWFEKFMNGYVAPSTSLACFSLLLIGPNEGLFSYIKISVAMLLLSLNSLFRIGWGETLNSLKSQVTVAHSMGASRHQIFKEILFPQLSKQAGLIAGMASVWACGDFAVSRILAHGDLTIAMMTETLMSGYRLHQAIILSSLIIVSGSLCFLFFVGGSYVLRRKIAS